MYISLADLIFFFGCCIALIIGAFLIISLIKLNKVLQQINTLVSQNTDNINKTLELLPQISNNINHITITAKESIGRVDNTLEVVESSIYNKFDPSGDTTSNFLRIATTAGDVISGLMNFYSMLQKKEE